MTVRQMPHDVGSEQRRRLPQTMGMSLDEGHVCYLVDEKKIGGGGNKKEAVGTATIKKNSVALVRTRTIPTERPPPVGEVSANFCG